MIGTLAFWMLSQYIHIRRRQHWYDLVDTWEVLTGFAEDETGCKVIVTEWPDGTHTQRNAVLSLRKGG